MSKLITINNNSDQALLDELLDSELTIFEDIQGSKIFVNWDGEQFTIKSKNIKADPINLIDVAYQKYYNSVIIFFDRLDDRIKGLMNKKWWFGFEYFPDTTPANVKYNVLPKNNLILTSIYRKGKFDYTIEELQEYSNLFDTEYLPVVFKGKLSEDQKEAIQYFLSTSEEDLEFVFGEKNFTFFFYKMLNPSSKNSFLMNNDFQDNLEKLVLRINGEDRRFQLLNPLYTRLIDSNSTEYVEIYSLILLNFLDYCQLVDINDIPLKGDRKDMLYINMICKLFNMYMANAKDDLTNFDFEIPKFFDKDKFKININILPNKLTKEYLKEDSKFEYVFKVILGSFNKPRKKPIGIFTDRALVLFNNFVGKIDDRIDEVLNKYKETELRKKGLIDFSEYIDIDYDVDGNGDVYQADMWDEFEDPSSKKKGKKGYYEEDDKKGASPEDFTEGGSEVPM